MANQYLYELVDTWNSVLTTYNAIKMNVADGASAANSKLLNLQVGSAEKFTVDKAGNLVAAGGIAAGGPISGGSLSLATALPVASGGTGAVSAADALTSLGAQKALAAVTTIELGDLVGGGDRPSIIDLHARDGSDFDARIIRNAGVNGTLQINQSGSGQVQINASGGFYVNGSLGLTASGTANAATANTLPVRDANGALGAQGFTGNILVTATVPSYRLLYPGVRTWAMRIAAAGTLQFVDESSGTVPFFVQPDGSIGSSSLGDIGTKFSTANVFGGVGSTLIAKSSSGGVGLSGEVAGSTLGYDSGGSFVSYGVGGSWRCISLLLAVNAERVFKRFL